MARCTAFNEKSRLAGVEPRIVNCPECGQPAEVLARTTLTSTDGPIEHIKVRCLLTGRWFFTIDVAHESPAERPAAPVRLGDARRARARRQSPSAGPPAELDAA